MASEAVTALIGAGVGGAIAAGGTWFVSTRLEQRRDARRLRGVIGLLAAELENNRDRIRANRDHVTRERWANLLTLGDWDANKAAFSQLVRDESLWHRVVTTYAAIFEAISGRQDPPDPGEIDAVRGDLIAAREELTR